MIPNNLIDFLNKTVFMTAGSSDADLQPAVTRTWGAKIDIVATSMTIFGPENVSEKLLKNLSDNGKIAVTISEAITHKTYQFKGTFTESRTSNKEESKFQDKYVEKIFDFFKNIYKLPETTLNNLGEVKYKPSYAVTFKIEEIFNQTPGPEAGKRIF